MPLNETDCVNDLVIAEVNGTRPYKYEHMIPDMTSTYVVCTTPVLGILLIISTQIHRAITIVIIDA